ncbi:MAG: hypothetical protein NWQ53_04485 [Flavobacteriales bacterium]|nr:hypothetical protein [Flavobacteriales bacterium]
MNKEIIELAIRSPKKGVLQSDFITAKNNAVKKLVSLNGIGPEREFEPFSTVPEKDEKVYVGMTKYASQGKIYRAMMSFGFIVKLMKFMKMMDPLAGVFIQPVDDSFDYEKFANKENVTEIALLKPKAGISKEAFLKERARFLSSLDAESEVVKSYTFNVTGGFKGKDTFPHFTIYKDKAAFEAVTKRVRNESFVQDFFKVFDVEIITFNTTLK